MDDTICATCWRRASASAARTGYETIQAAPTSYVVDQTRGVNDPRGMFCERLGVAMHAVAVRTGAAAQSAAGGGTLPSVDRAPALRALCQRPCHPDPDEMSLGVTLIDMGAGCTSIAVFMEDSLVHVDSVPLGGAHITADIAEVAVGAARRGRADQDALRLGARRPRMPAPT